ncbi:MAG: VOC family protein [Pseudoxanthomonas sp.]
MSQPITAENQSQGVLEIVGPDLDALLDFYLSIGFMLERRTGDFAVVHWHGQRLFLAGNPDAPIRDCWSNLRIMVADVDALWRQANRLQLKVGAPIGDRYFGLRDFVLVDPAGFGLRFAQVLDR